MDANAEHGTGGSREALRRRILDCGFDRVGFARAERAPHADAFLTWLERGHAAGMEWLARATERRLDPRVVLSGCRTVVVVALHYEGSSRRSSAPDSPERPTSRVRISTYARGRDYHRVMEARLVRAAECIRSEARADCRWYVDTGPVLERDWAHEAGVGWIGKNALVIDPERGSHFFLGVILTTAAVEPDAAAVDHCGSCRACLDACPTQAIVDAREVDSRRCISYLTIEHRGEFPAEARGRTAPWIFGCDVCQEVCPFNRGEPRPGDPELAPRAENLHPDPGTLLALGEDGFRERFRGTPILRAKWTGFRRNVEAALGQVGVAGSAGDPRPSPCPSPTDPTR